MNIELLNQQVSTQKNFRRKNQNYMPNCWKIIRKSQHARIQSDSR